MITRYRSKKAMAQVEILKELIDSIKTELGGKIDTLTKTLYSYWLYSTGADPEKKIDSG